MTINDNGLRHTALTRAAQTVSDVFSPILMPVYMMAVALWLTPLASVGTGKRLVVLGVVGVLTAIVPTALIFTLIKLGKAGDVSLATRKERTIPYIAGAAVYEITACYLGYIHAPTWLYAFYIGGALSALIALLITLKWKISAHASAVGGVAAATLWLVSRHLITGGAMVTATAVVVLCGLVGTSRLILCRHTPGQVYAGYALGAGCELAAILVLA